MKVFLTVLSLCVLGVSCERHDFEETKKLHQHGGHDSHGDSHGDGHHDGKKEEGHGAAH